MIRSAILNQHLETCLATGSWVGGRWDQSFKHDPRKNEQNEV